ncbi:uncharacterized protein LOC123301410 [Chrysoperla carnea]|uniref:uncharacterized protein LOC123301410 n=1 Tax=Chrysoperla carnea TaxID=189513 RepID=UPI001D0739F0|nr:uncharacterized protein LOC123301410 [Chrysoperla carnea]
MTNDIELSRLMTKNMRQVVNILKNHPNNIEKRLKHCQLNVRYLQKCIKNSNCLGSKKHLESCISNMLSFREQLKAMIHGGGGYTKGKKIKGMKWEDLECAFESHEKIRELKYFNTKNEMIGRTDIKFWYTNNVEEPLLIKLEEFQERDSGRALSGILNLKINVNKCKQLRGSSYIRLPTSIEDKKACINVQNDDDACFARAVTSALFPAKKHSYRTTSYLHYEIVLKLKGITFPMTLNQLEKHSEDCQKQNECKIVIPTSYMNRNVIQFKNFKNKEHVPLVIYADVECYLKPIKVNGYSYQQKYQQHVAYSIGFYICCTFEDKLNYYKSYRGENCEKWFATELKEIGLIVHEKYSNPLPVTKLRDAEKDDFYGATICHICEKPLNGDRNLDHCHLTGRYRGISHKKCNLQYQDCYTIPVIFHNLSGYDGHFTDSYRHLADSLDNLSSLLTEYKILHKNCFDGDDEKYKLLTRKGVFPYDYVDNLDKLNERSLPPIDSFFNKLNEFNISDIDYNHAKKVWKMFDIKTMGEYSDRYLKIDILLLADIFETFRDKTLDLYKLDAAHYYTTPGLAFDAALKITKTTLKTLPDIDMVRFIERGIRGGLSQCSNRYSKANNKYMSDYNCNEDSKYIMYYDVNNLYDDVLSVPDDSPHGYILEVDLKYPEDLHDLHNDLPFCPIREKPPGSKTEKLVTTLTDKERYLRKTDILFDKPIIDGFSILEIAKTSMYDFHYGFIIKIFPGG